MQDQQVSQQVAAYCASQSRPGSALITQEDGMPLTIPAGLFAGAHIYIPNGQITVIINHESKSQTNHVAQPSQEAIMSDSVTPVPVAFNLGPVRALGKSIADHKIGTAVGAAAAGSLYLGYMFIQAHAFLKYHAYWKNVKPDTAQKDIVARACDQGLLRYHKGRPEEAVIASLQDLEQEISCSNFLAYWYSGFAKIVTAELWCKQYLTNLLKRCISSDSSIMPLARFLKNRCSLEAIFPSCLSVECQTVVARLEAIRETLLTWLHCKTRESLA
jgi:hypothetical protein